LANGGDLSSVVVEHAGDIYYLNGDREQALTYWQQALKMAEEESAGTDDDKQSDTSDTRTDEQMKCLKKKIAQKKYFAE
jgi:tetratricopeptide (TPR) repeat protein